MSVSAEVLQINGKNKEFDAEDLLKEDEVGMICWADKTIKEVWSVLYQELSRKKEKKTQVWHSTMGSTPKLGTLYIAFREIAMREKKDVMMAEMFDRRNCPILRSGRWRKPPWC